jgi:phosphoglycerate dehydrogenase-like enzyme
MNLRWRLLVSGLHPRWVLDRYRPLLEEHGIEVVVPSGDRQYLTEAEMLDLVDETIDAIACSDDQITDRVMAKAPRLRVISKWGVGTDSIDRAAAASRGIAIYNSPGAFNDAVADLVLGHLIWFARRPDRSHAIIRDGGWDKVQGRSLRGQTLGIVGVGNIGREVTRRARPFGLRILGCDIRPVPPEFIAETGLQVVSFEVLLRESDYISLHCNLNASSRHLMRSSAFALMKPGSVLVNTARGPVVDEAALIAALAEGHLGGAALDVFEDEPIAADSPLRRFENVLLSAHNAFNTAEAVAYVHENTYRNVIAGLHAATTASAGMSTSRS